MKKKAKSVETVADLYRKPNQRPGLSAKKEKFKQTIRMKEKLAELVAEEEEKELKEKEEKEKIAREKMRDFKIDFLVNASAFRGRFTSELFIEIRDGLAGKLGWSETQKKWAKKMLVRCLNAVEIEARMESLQKLIDGR